VVLVRGVLVDGEAAPAGGRVLHVAVVDANGKAFVEVRESEILNPTDSTDAGGRFSISVPVAFFAGGTSFTVGAARAGAELPPGMAQFPLLSGQRNGADVLFSYPGKRTSIELGEIVLPAPE
jgi:hypothetical protein